jgi:hypothetical protein
MTEWGGPSDETGNTEAPCLGTKRYDALPILLKRYDTAYNGKVNYACLDAI